MQRDIFSQCYKNTNEHLISKSLWAGKYELGFEQQLKNSVDKKKRKTFQAGMCKSIEVCPLYGQQL